MRGDEDVECAVLLVLRGLTPAGSLSMGSGQAMVNVNLLGLDA